MFLKMGRVVSYISALIALILVIVLALYLLTPKPAKPPENIVLKAVSFAGLPNWSENTDFSIAFSAFQKSCASILNKPSQVKMQGAAVGGVAGDWKPVCIKANQVSLDNEQNIRAFYEANFTAFSVSLNDNSEGLFTGYFEPLLNGSFERSDQFQYPLYGPPKDLVSVDLGQFRPALKGERIAGKINQNRLVPYEDRAEIDTAGLRNKADILLWVDDPVDVFFLHIQGSGRVKLPGGNLQSVGYAAQNGHSYRAIGRDLIDMGAIAREDISMQSIRTWLTDNPDAAPSMMQRNRSYIFFRLIEGGEGPFGSAGVALTAGHSLAVDLRHLPMHAPIWLSSSYPDPAVPGQDIVMNRLMVAQDTGGAIRGEIRGDVFWGFGEKASAIAGKMQNSGQYWLLLPNELAKRVEAGFD